MIQVLSAGLLTAEGMKNILSILNGGDPVPDSFHLKLYVDGWSHSQANVYADFLANDADYDGYADATLTFSDPLVTAGPGAVLVSSNAVIPSTGGVTPNTIAGAVLVARETAGPVNRTWAYWDFPMPVLIDSLGQFIGGKVMFALPGIPGTFVLET